MSLGMKEFISLIILHKISKYIRHSYTNPLHLLQFIILLTVPEAPEVIRSLSYVISREPKR